MADEWVLRHYLERVAGQDLLSLRDAERALSLMADGSALGTFMSGLAPNRQVTVVRDLCRLHGSFEPQHVEPGVVTLLNLLPTMPHDPEDGLSARRCVRLATYNLLTALGGRGEAASAAKAILPQIETLGSKALLVKLLAHPAQGDDLVTEEVGREFLALLAADIREAFDDDAINDSRNYAELLVLAADAGNPIILPDTSEVTFRIAHSSMDRHSVDDEWTTLLNWELLALLYGDANTARQRIRHMCTEFDEQNWKSLLEEWQIGMAEARATLEAAQRSLEGDATQAPTPWS